MCLVVRIRALMTLILLATYSPVGIIVHPADEQPGFHLGHLAISVFTRRLTRVAAAEQFDFTRAGVSRCPSRFVRRAISDTTDPYVTNRSE
jgi:hypothetical protein